MQAHLQPGLVVAVAVDQRLVVGHDCGYAQDSSQIVDAKRGQRQNRRVLGSKARGLTNPARPAAGIATRF